ncbi:hypothetical protein AVEN_81768-1, partial [Araneus ventricosus]
WLGEVILTSRSEATRGLFRDGPRNFEPRSDDEDDPSSSFRAAPAGGRLAAAYDSARGGPYTRRIFGGSGFRSCGPLVPRSGPYHWANAALGFVVKDKPKISIVI